MESIDAIIKVITKLCVRPVEFKVYETPSTVAHEAFKQQGIRDVIAILDGIKNGNISVQDVMKE
jgi:hypothetical protein